MTGDKGKYAEKKFTEFLKEQSKNPIFDWDRIPDARTARGRIGKRKGDYYIFHAGTAYLIELKECKHDYRMPTKRLTQLPKMIRFAMTGNNALAVIYHSQTKLWRALPIGYLKKHRRDPSYNISKFATWEKLNDLWFDVCTKRYLFPTSL